MYTHTFIYICVYIFVCVCVCVYVPACVSAARKNVAPDFDILRIQKEFWHSFLTENSAQTI